MPTEFRYVGRKDDATAITGQQGYSDFSGQFDPSIFQEYFQPVPQNATLVKSDADQAREQQTQMTAVFDQIYLNLLGSVPVSVRRQITQLRLEVNEHFRVPDIEAVQTVISEFAIPAELPSEIQDEMTAAKTALLQVIGV